MKIDIEKIKKVLGIEQDKELAVILGIAPAQLAVLKRGQATKLTKGLVYLCGILARELPANGVQRLREKILKRWYEEMKERMGITTKREENET